MIKIHILFMISYINTWINNGKARIGYYKINTKIRGTPILLLLCLDVHSFKVVHFAHQNFSKKAIKKPKFGFLENPVGHILYVFLYLLPWIVKKIINRKL